jgi:hypothetical protein
VDQLNNKGEEEREKEGRGVDHLDSRQLDLVNTKLLSRSQDLLLVAMLEQRFVGANVSQACCVHKTKEAILSYPLDIDGISIQLVRDRQAENEGRDLVKPGVGPVITLSSLRMAFNREDFPTLGRPIKAIWIVF